MSSHENVARLDLVRQPEDKLTSYLTERGIDIISYRKGGLIECEVPSQFIDNEDVAVKKAWSEELAEQMRELAKTEGGTGQQAAVNLGYIPGVPVLKIIDGFHRNTSLMLNGETKIFSAAKQTDWDGLYDERIFLARDHTHVRYSRVVQWIREVWQHSDLAEHMTVLQAINLYSFSKMTGEKLGLDSEIVAEAKKWVGRKEKKWGIAAMTIHGHLTIAENVDPNLVHATTEKTRSDVLEAPTQAILKIFSDKLPGNFELQNLVMGAAKAQNLTGPQIRALSLRVKNSDPVTAENLIEAIDWKELEGTYEETKARALRAAYDPRKKGATVLNNTAKEIRRVVERTEQIVQREDEVTPEMRVNLEQAKIRAELLSSQLGRLAGRIGAIIEVNPVEMEDSSYADDEPTGQDLAAAGTAVAKIDLTHPQTVEITEKKPEPRHNSEFNREVLALPEDTPEMVENIVNYLMHEDIDFPSGYTPDDMRKAWLVLDTSPDSPNGWRKRFNGLQQAGFARARVEERMERI